MSPLKSPAYFGLAKVRPVAAIAILMIAMLALAIPFAAFRAPTFFEFAVFVISLACIAFAALIVVVANTDRRRK